MQAEVRAVQQAQSIITETALGIWPKCTVGSFGSQANATALPGSDIDITILGVIDFDGASGIKRHVTCLSSLRLTSDLGDIGMSRSSGHQEICIMC